MPPPPGEDDAYSAPTRLNSIPPEHLLQALKEAARKGAPLKPQSLPSRPNDRPPSSAPGPRRSTPEWIRPEELTPEKPDSVPPPSATIASATSSLGAPARRVAVSVPVLVGGIATLFALLVVLMLLVLR